jgi:outer membrane protein TolC
VPAARRRSTCGSANSAPASATSSILPPAEAELASTDATTVALARQRADLEATIALLSGRPLAEIASVEVPRRAARSDAPFRAQLPQGDASAMLLARPDVRQAEPRSPLRAPTSRARALRRCRR